MRHPADRSRSVFDSSPIPVEDSGGPPLPPSRTPGSPLPRPDSVDLEWGNGVVVFGRIGQVF